MINVFLLNNAENMQLILLQLRKIECLKNMMIASNESYVNNDLLIENAIYNESFNAIDNIIELDVFREALNALSHEALIYCMKRYLDIIENHKSSVLDLAIEHKMGCICIAKIKLAARISDAQFCIIAFDYNVFMIGKWTGISYDANQNVYMLNFEAKHNIRHEQMMEDIKKNLYGVYFINNIKTIYMQNILINRCTDEIKLFKKKTDNIKKIVNFYPYTIKCLQIHPYIDKFECRFHAYWNVTDIEEYIVHQKITDIRADKQTTEKILPKAGSKYGNYTIKNVDIKYINSKHYTQDYSCDVDMTLDVMCEHNIRIDEICNVALYMPVADKIAKIELESIDIYGDVTQEMLVDVNETVDRWIPGNEYTIGDQVLYNNNVYRCTRVNEEIEFETDYWKQLRANVNRDKIDILDKYTACASHSSSVLNNILQILEQIVDYYLYAFMIYMMIPINSDNMNLAVGDCIDLSQFNLDNVGKVGYITNIEVIYNTNEQYIRIAMMAQVAVDEQKSIDKSELTEKKNILIYNKLNKREICEYVRRNIQRYKDKIRMKDYSDNHVFIDTNHIIENNIQLNVAYDI